jgi:ABC-2 type transport system permease protein
VIYAVEALGVSDRIRELIMMNPIAAILEQFRHAVIDPGAPTAAEAAGGTLHLLVPLGVLVAAFVVGYRVFDRAAPRIAEEL